MIRNLGRAMLFAAAAAALVGTTVGLSAQDAKKYTIEDIMKKGHGSKGLVKGIAKEVKDGKWDDAKTDAALLKDFGEALGSLKPGKGDEASWKKLSAKYKDSTAAVATAVDKKDAKGANAALGVIGKSCGECHKAHKPD